MARQKQKYKIDLKRGMVQAKFYELQEIKKQPPRRDIATIEEYNFKTTSRGRKKRSQLEQQNFLELKYQEKLKELLREQEELTLKAKKVVYIQSAMQDFLDYSKVRLSGKTYLNYTRHLNYYLRVVGDHPLSDFKVYLLSKMIVELQSKKPPAANSTINHYIRIFKRFFSWCRENEYITQEPPIKSIRETKREPHVFSPGDLDRILKHILFKMENSKGRSFAFHQSALRAFMVFTQTGMRLSECFYLPLKNIKLKERMILIRDNPEVGYFIKEKKEKNIPISEKLALFLTQDLSERKLKECFYLDNGKGGLIYKQSRSLTQSFARYYKELDIPFRKAIHAFRSTIGDQLLNDLNISPDVVSQLLGHSNINTTLRHYQRKREAPTKEAVDLLPIDNESTMK